MNYTSIIEKKIVSEKELKQELAIWRFQSKKIVFTNGCFDLIHPGHIHLLNTARSFGDILIVGLNTDASVQKIKPGRPLQNEQARSLIMASFEVVDAVILFEEETPLNLIKLIEPDVLVKGADYSPDKVVGKEEVERTGGRIELVTFLEGISTTGIMKKIREQP